MNTLICRELKQLHPELRARFNAAREYLGVALPGFAPFETWRTAERQGQLYAQGRTLPGPRVTSAKPWRSWHQYRLAIDVALYLPGDPAKKIKPTWSWDFDRELVKAHMVGVHGLEPGPPFEGGHFQLTAGLTLNEAFALHSKSGHEAVWDEVTRRLALEPR